MRADDALRRHFADPAKLRAAVLALLRLRPGPIHIRHGYSAHAVFGFSPRACAVASELQHSERVAA